MRKMITSGNFLSKTLCFVVLGFLASVNVFGQTKANWNGTWKYLSDWSPSTLTIKVLPKNKIKFSISASSGANSGEIDGVATIIGNKARFTAKDSITKEVCRLEFIHNGKSIDVNEENCSGYGGIGVGFGGNFSKNPKKVENNFVKLEVFPNKEVDGKFRTLVGKDYRSFISAFHMSGEDEDKDSLGAKVFSGCVRGICPYNAAIIMFDKNANFWAAVIEAGEKESTIRYYSNAAEWTEKMPKTIEEWVADKRNLNENLTIVYKNKS